MPAKTEAEIAIISAGAKRLKNVMARIVEKAVIGVTGSELNFFAEKLIAEADAKPAFKGYGKPPYPSSLCVSINSCVVHGVPSNAKLKAGDIVGLDLGLIYQGLYSDMARTVSLDPVTSLNQRLLKCTREALDLAIDLVRPGIKTGDIGSAVQKFVEAQGFGVVRDLSGHGLGHQLHEPPQLPNFGHAGEGDELSAGMVLAIEPMVTAGSWQVKVASDKWSIITVDGSDTAHWEDMVVVTANGCNILTR
jgi:methionyl aminopeptidase